MILHYTDPTPLPKKKNYKTQQGMGVKKCLCDMHTYELQAEDNSSAQ